MVYMRHFIFAKQCLLNFRVLKINKKNVANGKYFCISENVIGALERTANFASLCCLVKEDLFARCNATNWWCRGVVQTRNKGVVTSNPTLVTTPLARQSRETIS